MTGRAPLSVALVATSGEAAITVLLATGAASLPTALAAHALISLFLVGAAALFCARELRSPPFLLLIVATPVMGPIGAFGAALAAALHGLFWRSAIPFEQWYDALVPRPESTPSRALYERLALRRCETSSRSSVASFQDVLAMGTPQQKHFVLTAIGDQFRPEFAPALRAALMDVEPAVRVQAASVSARIENGFLERSLQLEERRRRTPDDPDVLRDVAGLHSDWAATGLLDTARARHERLRARDAYSRLLELRPDDIAIADANGRLLLALDLPDQAFPYLRSAAARPGASPSDIMQHLDCLYRLGRIRELRQAARASWPVLAEASIADDLRDAVRGWAGVAAPVS